MRADRERAGRVRISRPAASRAVQRRSGWRRRAGPNSQPPVSPAPVAATAGRRSGSAAMSRPDLWCHVSLPRAGTFSTRSSLALPHHGSDAWRRRAKTRQFPRAECRERPCGKLCHALAGPVGCSPEGRPAAGWRNVAVQTAQPRRAGPPALLIGDDDVESCHGPAPMCECRHARDQASRRRTVMSGVDLDAYREPVRPSLEGGSERPERLG